MKRISIQESNGNKILLNNDIQINSELQQGVKIATLIDAQGQQQNVFAPLPDDINLTVNGLTAFANVAALKAATGLKVGDTVMTKGYYTANDGGGSLFTVIASSSYVGSSWKQAISGETTPYVDDATLVELQGGLYANIIVPANNEVSFLQMGAKPITSYYKAINSKGYYYSVQEDNKPYMLKWLAFNDRRGTTYNLFIPAGAYSFSPTWLLRSNGAACDCGIRIRGECMQHTATSTILIPHTYSQEYILRLGYKTKADGSYCTTSEWLPMRSSVIKDIAFGTTKYALIHNGYSLKYGNVPIASSNDENHIIESTGNTATAGNDGYRYVTKAALWLDCCPYGQFDGLYFTKVAGTCMRLTQCYESHFGYINIRGCGRITANGSTNSLVYINAPGPSDVSACYFYYFNFEENIGNLFYSATHNFTHNEFNDIQIEGKLLSVSSAIGTFNSLSSNQKYDTDENYTTPAQNEGEIFGKWIKWFVFTGNMGFMPNYINSISASNFGNGFKRYRTYSMSDGVLKDMYGNTITDGYVLENGTYYAVDANNNKIVDYYRYYALFGIDENNPNHVNQDKNGNKSFDSFVWNIGSVYLYRGNGMTEYTGPWVTYLRCSATTFNFVVNHTFAKNEYPYYFDKVKRVNIAKEVCSIPGAVPFANLITNNGGNLYTTTKSNSIAPNGICLNLHGVINGFSFMAVPNTKYYIRAYCTQSRYDSLVSTNNSRFNWGGLFSIGGTDYNTSTYVTINNAGWITLPMPDLNLTDITKITFGNYTGGDAYSKNFFRNLYLDVLCPIGSFSN